jgi:RNA 2',3'-cyclic 3'-phosphodiesterase
VRLFVALPVDASVRAALSAAVESSRAGADDGRDTAGSGTDWRWTRPEGWHVTLAFLGEVAPDRVTDAAWATVPVAAGTGAIELRLGPLGRFGRGVLHVAVEDRPEGVVADLGERVQTALAAAGVPVQQREVRPHLTLARARRGARPAVPALEPHGVSWVVDEARLYASHLGAGGAAYEVLERFPLL